MPPSRLSYRFSSMISVDTPEWRIAWPELASLGTPASDCECLHDSQNGTDFRFKLRDDVVSKGKQQGNGQGIDGAKPAPVIRHWRRTSLKRRPFVEEFRTFCLSCPGVEDTVWSLGDTLQELLSVM